MAIEFKNIEFIYNQNSFFEKRVLKDINIVFDDNDIVAIIGNSGSGKSTLIQLTNGLLKPTSGKVIVDNIDITDKKCNLSLIRQKIGVIFQYPEHQLFCDTVLEDIIFSLKLQNFDKKIIDKKLNDILKIFEFDKKLLERNPYELSLGQKRKVALMGILINNPKYLILDEPTAGLDPKSIKELFNTLLKIKRKNNTTIIFITHNIELVAEFAKAVLILDNGTIKFYGKSNEFFMNQDNYKDTNIIIPELINFFLKLKDRFKNENIDYSSFTYNHILNETKRVLKKYE